MSRVRVLRRAVLEATAASDWYAERDLRAAEEFRIALDETVANLAELPGSGHLWPGHEGVRRARVRGFPFWVVYEEFADGITVLAIAHQKRNPNYWREP
ncbi:MAG: type II toxin-antitoxin system RelE/ParE family toxin [Archangium sp.]|nr:type II toxin-antitoxin system RelE/ParE family toxin [Archangium sp.]MDP3153008.1 type II toxin-antitoxin system RelE/ParE family toxin [Archangium sp.]MDP3572604.1 type II toxin-antitoxin system RelE/ParE family toxin [Archangium sp.]